MALKGIHRNLNADKEIVPTDFFSQTGLFKAVPYRAFHLAPIPDYALFFEIEVRSSSAYIAEHFYFFNS